MVPYAAHLADGCSASTLAPSGRGTRSRPRTVHPSCSPEAEVASSKPAGRALHRSLRPGKVEPTARAVHEKSPRLLDQALPGRMHRWDDGRRMRALRYVPLSIAMLLVAA